jgi:hypothetical protein
MNYSPILTHGTGDRTRPLTPEERRAQLRALGKDDAWVERKLADEQRKSQELLARMSPPGAIPGLHPLVEAKRLSFGIVDEYFSSQAIFDRLFLFQTAQGDGETMGEGIIQMPDTSKQWDKETAPQGILLSAGMEALDTLKSHGVELGHTVIMNRLSPYHFRVGWLGGNELYMLVCRAGDIVGSYELMNDLRERRCSVVASQVPIAEGSNVMVWEHALRKDGQLWNPSSPWIADDQ